MRSNLAVESSMSFCSRFSKRRQISFWCDDTGIWKSSSRECMRATSCCSCGSASNCVYSRFKDIDLGILCCDGMKSFFLVGLLLHIGCRLHRSARLQLLKVDLKGFLSKNYKRIQIGSHSWRCSR